MARIDRIIARRAESARKPQVVYVKKGPGRRQVLMRYDVLLKKEVPVMTSAQHTTGNPWWRSRFADLVDKRSSVKPASPRKFA